MPSNPTHAKGGATSNCYCSQDEATDYLDNIYGADDWAQLDSDQMDRLILTAAKQIDSFSVLYDSVSATQAMNFPLDTDDADLGDGYAEAKEANILQAYYLFQNQDAINESRTGAMQGITAETIGPTSRTTIGFNAIRAVAPEVLHKLVNFLSLSVKLRRG